MTTTVMGGDVLEDLGDAELLVLVSGDVGLHEGEVVGVARDEGQVLDLRLADDPDESLERWRRLKRS